MRGERREKSCCSTLTKDKDRDNRRLLRDERDRWSSKECQMAIQSVWTTNRRSSLHLDWIVEHTEEDKSHLSLSLIVLLSLSRTLCKRRASSCWWAHMRKCIEPEEAMEHVRWYRRETWRLRRYTWRNYCRPIEREERRYPKWRNQSIVLVEITLTIKLERECFGKW